MSFLARKTERSSLVVELPLPFGCLTLIPHLFSCHLHFLILKIVKDTSIVPRAWSVSQTEKEDFGNEVSDVVCVYSEAKLCVVMN